MKKTLLLTALVVLFAVPAMAAIKDTRHNLGTTGDFGYRSSDTTQICVFCHTPHNAAKAVPLWNRSNPTSAFMLYTASTTLNMPAKPTNLETNSISRFCLSCHDAVTSTNLGGRVQNTPETLGKPTIVNNGDLNLKGKGSLGTNLTNDHPVGFRFDDAYDTRDLTIRDRAAASALVSGGLKFFRSNGTDSDFMECATCHEVHGKVNVEKFLVKSNASSSLCLTCHIK